MPWRFPRFPSEFTAVTGLLACFYLVPGALGGIYLTIDFIDGLLLCVVPRFLGALRKTVRTILD